MTETQPDAVVIERTLAAPIDLVWSMWTEPEHFTAWYGPTGARITVVAMDLRVGGTRHIGMEMDTPNGPMRMGFTGEHLDVVRPRRLAYTEAMADENGDATSDQPATEVHVDLVTLDDGTTRMTMTHLGIPSGSPGEAGWNMAFDQLAEVVTR